MNGQTNVYGLTLPEAFSMADQLGTQLMQGTATAALHTRSNQPLCTRDGKVIFLWGKQDEPFRQTEESAVSRANTAAESALSAHVMDSIAGTLATPLLTRTGDALATRNGQELSARTVRDGAQDGESTAAAVAVLLATVDAFRLEYLVKTRALTAAVDELFAALDKHTTDALKGIVFGQMATADGKPITSTGGQELAAWRSFAGTQSAAEGTPPAVYEAIDAHRRDYLATAQELRNLESALATA